MDRTKGTGGYIEDGEGAEEKGEGGWGRRETSLVPRKLPAGEYTAATGSFRGTSRGLYVLMYSLIGLPLSSVPHATPPFNPSRSPLRGLYSERYMLMESYIWFIMRSRTADEYHLYWRQERERERKGRKIEKDEDGDSIRSASGYYRSIINIVSLAGVRRGIMITLSRCSPKVGGGRVPGSRLKNPREYFR